MSPHSDLMQCSSLNFELTHEWPHVGNNACEAQDADGDRGKSWGERHRYGVLGRHLSWVVSFGEAWALRGVGFRELNTRVTVSCNDLGWGPASCLPWACLMASLELQYTLAGALVPA